MRGMKKDFNLYNDSAVTISVLKDKADRTQGFQIGSNLDISALFEFFAGESYNVIFNHCC
jgi:hypothetical protein